MKKITLDSNEFDSEDQLHLILKKKLNLPDYYGNNLDALWDCLTGWIELPMIIEWKNFDESRKKLGELADKVLKIFKEAEEELFDFKIEIVDACHNTDADNSAK